MVNGVGRTSPFWNWFWHSFAFVGILLLSLPSFAIRRIVRRFATHRALRSEDVSSVRVGHHLVDGDERTDVIEAFNQAIFLRKQNETFSPADCPLAITAQDGTEYGIVAGQREANITRVRKGQPVTYEVRAPRLRAIILSLPAE